MQENAIKGTWSPHHTSYGCLTWTLKTDQIRTEAAMMQFMRWVTSYILSNKKRNDNF
jgi:hypothetical protein